MSDPIDAIRDRLAKATPGPWELQYEHCGCEYCTHAPYPYAINGPDTTHTMRELSEDYRQRYGHQATEISALRDEDAALIANAPADLAYLLAELDKARAGLAEAWDEGWAARAKRPHLGMHESVPAPSHINPYRTERP